MWHSAAFHDLPNGLQPTAFLPPIHEPSTPIPRTIHQAHSTPHTANVLVSESIQTGIPSSSHKTGISFIQREDCGKWNDSAFILLGPEGPLGFRLFALKLIFFSKVAPECTSEILIPFTFVDRKPLLRRTPICKCLFLLFCCLFTPPHFQYVYQHV